MVKFNYWLLMLSVAGSFLVLMPAHGREQLGMHAEMQKNGEKYFLKLKMENLGTEDLTLYRDGLPWLDRPGNLSLKGIALTANFEEMMEQGRIHHLLGTITLKPTEFIDGSIALDERFADFDQVHAKSSIAILWSYAPRSPTSKDLNRHSGVFVIPMP
ncbi:hypothetical protein BCF11_4591 [Collimonas sp. PA-H2]|uniref:hypothetical protein n=1 Tax=Collimonas sp. PA-H2 TaxID=1881062 RepID=UPI000BF593A6|nr:hypothetical protein [Collimonas sp. PA-H2]PFH12116.1 hypothetical protein BCF11_4591 [Collimonas sp. PA-H2]